LSVGIQAVEKLQELIERRSGPLRNKDSLHSLLKILCRYAGLKEIIEELWLERTNRKPATG
jgi:hypothetical protein